jgi:LacI family transcriptional regulator
MKSITSKLKRVALIVESQVAPRRRMLAGVARYIQEHEPWAVYLKPYGVEKSLPNWLRDWHGEGIIAALADRDAEVLANVGIPVVDVVGFVRDPNVPLVHTDDHAVGRLGAEHLLERGFRHFAFIEYPFFWSVDRREGFAHALSGHGLDVTVLKLSFPGAGSGGPGFWEQQQRALAEWIGSLPKPVGVMASTDLLGQQCLEACQRAGAMVPDEVAVIGADNDELICNICFPPLSSVIINDAMRGYQAAAVLDQMMQGKPPPKQTVYVDPAGVVSRASTDILAIEDQSVAQAVKFVRDHGCEKISVDDVVKAVPLSRSVLERRFRKVVGRTINDEIIRVRLNRAVELLSATPLALKVIAYKAGFGSPSYMGSVFREKLGRTPGSYRSGIPSSSRGELVRNSVDVRS